MALSRLSRAVRGGLALLAIATLLTGTAGCARKKVYREGTSTITGAVGEFVVVELASDPITGYSWVLVGQPDTRVVTLIESDYEAGPGAGGHQRWTFRLVGPGSTAITFGYGRTWANTPAEKATMFTVVVR